MHDTDKLPNMIHISMIHIRIIICSITNLGGIQHEERDKVSQCDFYFMR
ncbi:hypothetical protein SPIROBIBN47_410051 [uncultured spirochete]|uniref:Uncharacterized protein n=1 Tax=uncultured spirochete TaxID=156406 RepID=A0A3P3XM16_9SPIR|nr:hypothetical protein SPIROBIBN47_410051 [uncultured spirochete]